MKYSFGKNSFSFVLIGTLLLSSAAFVNDAWSMTPSEVKDSDDSPSKIIKSLSRENDYQADYIRANQELQKIKNSRHLLSNEDQALFDKMLEDVTKRMNGTIENSYLRNIETYNLYLKMLGPKIRTNNLSWEINKNTKFSDLLSRLHTHTGLPIDDIMVLFRFHNQLVSPDLVLWNSSVMYGSLGGNLNVFNRNILENEDFSVWRDMISLSLWK